MPLKLNLPLMQEINSYSEMISSLAENSKNYVLLYKKGSESSECSYNSIKQVLESGVKVNVMAADVSKVRDIHTKYDITSVPALLVFQGDNFERTIKCYNSSNNK